MVSLFHVKRETGAQASRETMKHEGGGETSSPPCVTGKSQVLF